MLFTSAARHPVPGIDVRQPPSGSANRSRLAKMLAFHRNPPAAVADVFHGGQLAATHMGLVDLRCTAKRAFTVIAAGVAEVAGFFGNGAALFTGISHWGPPSDQEYDAFYPGKGGGAACRHLKN